MKYSREDYLSKKVSHREYYSQFVNKEIKAIVQRNLGKKILESKDENFNDIPLNQWDYISFFVKEVLSTAEKVCVLKEAAKQIKEESQK